MRKLIFATFIITVMLLTACNSFEDKSRKWYDITKAEILKQSDLKADSMSSACEYRDSNFKCLHFYFHRHEFMEQLFRRDTLRGETHYSTDGNFELRREIAANGNYCFEGITYLKHFYGLSTWWDADTQLRQQGVRFNDQHIADWKEWDKNNKMSVTHHYRYSAIDSMPIINGK